MRDERDTGYVERCDGCTLTQLHYVLDGVRLHFVPHETVTQSV